MQGFPEKPAGCIVEEEVNSEGMTLRWPVPSPGAARYAVVAFLAFWLCGWAAGWVGAANQIVAGGGPRFFLVAWLGGWTVGGFVVVWTIWRMVQPGRPEWVRLEAESLWYSPGQSPLNPFQHNGWSHWHGAQATARSAGRAIEVARSQIRGFVLERVGERQRLCFDFRADRVEIGACLREPEREWLFAVLRKWHSPEQAPGATAGLASSIF